MVRHGAPTWTGVMIPVSTAGTTGEEPRGEACPPSLGYWDSLYCLACCRCSICVNDWMNVGASVEFLSAPGRSRGLELPFCSQALRHRDAGDGSSPDA